MTSTQIIRNLLSRGLASDIKVFVQQKYKDGITKPNAILKLFRQNGMVEPVKAKLTQFLKTLRTTKNTPLFRRQKSILGAMNASKFLLTKMSRTLLIFSLLLILMMLMIKN